MEISGINFHPNSVVAIGDQELTASDMRYSINPVTQSTSWRLRSPCLPPGFKTVRVTNPDGRFTELPNMVLYSAELTEVLEAASTPTAASSQPRDGRGGSGPLSRSKIVPAPYTSDFLTDSSSAPVASAERRRREPRVWGH
jgi:hypothetical protein